MARGTKGRVNRLYTNPDVCFIRLEDPEHEPKDGYFRLERGHPNYNALFSLVCMAAMSRRPIGITARDEIVSTENAEVLHMVLDF
jgi:hypothetical protein